MGLSQISPYKNSSLHHVTYPKQPKIGIYLTKAAKLSISSSVISKYSILFYFHSYYVVTEHYLSPISFWLIISLMLSTLNNCCAYHGIHFRDKQFLRFSFPLIFTYKIICLRVSLWGMGGYWNRNHEISWSHKSFMKKIILRWWAKRPHPLDLYLLYIYV